MIRLEETWERLRGAEKRIEALKAKIEELTRGGS